MNILKLTALLTHEKRVTLARKMTSLIAFSMILLLPSDVLFAQNADSKGLSTLNIRLSSKVIRPPHELVKTQVTISNIAIARPMVGPPSRSAILEDDQRHRMVVLSVEESGDLTAYLLDHIDLTPYLSELHSRTTSRGCAHDRMTITGGLGCVAICLKEILEEEVLP